MSLEFGSVYSLCTSVHFGYIGDFGVVYRAAITGSCAHESVAVKKVKGTNLFQWLNTGVGNDTVQLHVQLFDKQINIIKIK